MGCEMMMMIVWLYADCVINYSLSAQNLVIALEYYVATKQPSWKTIVTLLGYLAGTFKGVNQESIYTCT